MEEWYMPGLQERTPGVGREEEGEGGEGEKRRQAEVEEVRRKIQELEMQIEEAVSEEVEDYELAGEPHPLALPPSLPLFTISHLTMAHTHSRAGQGTGRSERKTDFTSFKLIVLTIV